MQILKGRKPVQQRFAIWLTPMQIARMLRRYSAALATFALVLTGCGQAERSEGAESNQTQADNGSDMFTNTVTEAMCGTPDERAHAVAAVAREPQINNHPDDVYDLASDLAEKGCPNSKD